MCMYVCMNLCIDTSYSAYSLPSKDLYTCTEEARWGWVNIGCNGAGSRGQIGENGFKSMLTETALDREAEWT